MVKLHIKHGDESQFLYETTTNTPIDNLTNQIALIYNGRLKVHRICNEMSMLAKHGVTLPVNMQGLTDEQITELKLKDEYADTCIPMDGYVEEEDGTGRRNGRAPTEKMRSILERTIQEAKDKISKKLVQADQCVTCDQVNEALQQLKGAVMIVYPMGLPPYDPVELEFKNQEELEGTQDSLDVIPEPDMSLWFSGKEMQRGKLLSDFVGKNEKTKVIVKIQKKGNSAPARERVVSEEEQKQMMAYYYRKQQELKKLEENEDHSYMDSEWADSSALKRSFQAPTEKMRSILERTIQEAKDKISKKLVQADQCVTCDQVNEALQQLKGAVMIVYPMGLPPYDPVELEFKNQEELEGTQDSLDVIPEPDMSLWFSGKEMQRGKLLSDFVGKNEKTKVIVKIQKKGNSAPARERVVSEEEQKQMMAYYYRKQQELKKLEENEDHSYMDSEWADSSALKRSFQGLNDIKWKPR
ncbi:unnamed protein product [Adineta steineri]|uniref:Uncharacterized protein n=2 Tax=Adineta steineri TaxID=433720 RepID=A0A814LVK2_9BILA|nr:unnamed protein product [Adineta steineri]